MVKTRGGHNFRPRVRSSSPPSAGRSNPSPAPAVAPPPPLLLPPLPPPPLLLPRAVLPWVLLRLLLHPMPLLLLLLLPHVGTILGLALFLPLPHILGQPGGPHLLKGLGPCAEESPLVPGPESASHHLLKALLGSPFRPVPSLNHQATLLPLQPYSRKC